MIGNSVLDAAFLFSPAIRDSLLATAVTPLLSDADQTLQHEYVKLIAWKFLMHGAARFYAGMKITTDDSVVYLAMASYLIEAAPFWAMYLDGGKVDFNNAAGMMFAPLLMIACLFLRKKSKFGKEP
eukprot:CAMPEP_0204829742 /NCGR_PEP_ID=MMETSP1346-20131115/8072_1 /ASSEMBLY_ACC=CAM_ASM_000771 /TAXON_ID=215587 /ORGANISM="Aplanochytrium stocchinoi, Strain GSBS06" /LENGTH=125 /DNA_ID=CAMNT_0051959791 /DNA_START=110 /DNA_END=487 /DNA_ORIENTATION=-